MIVSHRWRFVFVKTRKTAGTSVEIALSAVCGPEDVITPLSDPDERLRAELGHRGPQNFMAPLRGLSVATVRNGIRWRRRPLLFNHLSARHARRMLGRRRWDDYTTFTFERNPWDRAVSRYEWVTRHHQDPPSFPEYLRQYPLSQFDLYGSRRGVMVDHVLRYEELDDALSEIWDAIGLPDRPSLPRTKSGVRPASARDYRRLFSPEDRDLVARACRREIDLLGYVF